jgi:hypothetical protein
MICPLGPYPSMQCHSFGLDHLDQDSVTPFWKSEPIGLVAAKSLCRLEAERGEGEGEGGGKSGGKKGETLDAH